jgi:hypothetical protein
MKRIITTTGSVALIVTSLVMMSALIPAYAEDKKEKPIRIKWESVEGIIKYMVQMKDAADTVVLDRTVTDNYIDFILPPGSYRLRIGAINKFDKVSFWTDWDTIEIRKTVKQKFFSNRFPAQAGLKINFGVSYNMVLPDWNSMYKDSTFDLKYLGYMGSIGFHFGDSKYINRKNFIRFMGIELDAKLCYYAGKESIQFKSNLTNITGGIDLFLKSRLDAPINFYFRIGSGVSYSKQEYTRNNLLGERLFSNKVETLDPYFKTGVSIELNFLYALSLNIGTDYYLIFYSNRFFQSLHYYASLGFRI